MNNLRVVTFPDVVLFSVPLFILLMVVERISYLFHFHRDDEELGYGAKDTATSLSMGLGSLGWDILWGFGTALRQTWTGFTSFMFYLPMVALGVNPVVVGFCGGIFIVWDRLFGSFAPETERVVYGLTKNINTFNPLRVAYHEYAAIARDIRGAQWRDKIGYLFHKPGWSGQATLLHERGEALQGAGKG